MVISAFSMHILGSFSERVCKDDKAAGVSDRTVSVLLLICKTFRGDLDK